LSQCRTRAVLHATPRRFRLHRDILRLTPTFGSAHKQEGKRDQDAFRPSRVRELGKVFLRAGVLSRHQATVRYRWCITQSEDRTCSLSSSEISRNRNPLLRSYGEASKALGEHSSHWRKPYSRQAYDRSASFANLTEDVAVGPSLPEWPWSRVAAMLVRA